VYSQNNEEQIILDLFRDEIGTFLDIGACDGKLNSNTLRLVERGWSGVLVEPSPGAFQALYERHGQNPKLQLVNAAIGTHSHLAPFWDSWKTEPGYGTTERTNRDRWTNLVGAWQRFIIPVFPFAELLEHWRHHPFDFVSIDTEGTSAQLFQILLASCQKPKTICVEHDGWFQQCVVAAAASGYREVLHNAENLILTTIGPASSIQMLDRG
jgi:FkbM family methyltransferase